MNKNDDTINFNFRTNRSFAPFQIGNEKDKGRNKKDKYDKDIYYSKTESNYEIKKKNNNIIKFIKDKNKSDYFYSTNKMKISKFDGNDKFENIQQKTVKNLKHSDLNRYLNNAYNINIYNDKINIDESRPKTISLNNYFELNKIIQDKKSMNSIYNNINIYHNKFAQRKNHNNLINRKNKIYSETEKFMNKSNNINNYISFKNSDKSKKEKKLLELQNVLEELKLKQNEIQKELMVTKNENSELEKKGNIKNIYIKIKNILDNAINHEFNEDKNINTKFFKSLSNKEKCKFLRKIYLEKKMQKNLIEKINSLYNNSYRTINEADINTENDYNLNNLLNWIRSLIENVDYLNMQNDKIKYEINKKTKEKDKYKAYYSNWARLFCAKTKGDIIQRINELIKEQSINNTEKNKMIKMLFNNKKHS